MSVYRRAFLYTTRKKGKTALLLLILTVLMILVFMGTAINQTARKASAGLREELGGYFKIAPDYQKMSVNQRVDQALVDQVMEIEGIKSCNAMDLQYLAVENLTLEPGKFTLEGDEKGQMARFLGNTSSELHEYFYLNLFTLEEGRHLKPEDKGKALISKTLAQRNHLTLGDTVSARLMEGASRTAGAEKEFPFEIIGIFDEGYQEGISQNTPECDMASNFIFIDVASSQIINEAERGAANPSFLGGAAFFVKDPRELERIVEAVEELPGLDWQSLKLMVNNSAYESRMEPLMRLEGMTSLLVWLIATIGVIVVSLLLALWERDRIHEAGVLMSFGISRRNILWQHFLECTAVFLLAFCLALIGSIPLSGWVGGKLYSRMTVGEEENAVEQYDYLQDPVSLNALGESGELEVTLEPGAAVLLGITGTLIVGACVSMAFCVIGRRKPKELLTIME